MNSLQSVSDVRCQRLWDYLEEGWSIDPPIFVRPLWHTLNDVQDAYHFILTREGSLHLLVVPSSPEVDSFIRERRIALNRL